MIRIGAYDKLFKEINTQLQRHQIIVVTGSIVDASVIDIPLRKRKNNSKKTGVFNIKTLKYKLVFD